MKKIAMYSLAALILFVSSPVSAEWATIKNYDCLEVEKFTVDRKDYSSTKLERAAAIPEEILTNLQHKIVGETIRSKIISQVVKKEESKCSAKTLIYGGKVTDYKQGSRAARILIGLGAGKQKFEVESYLKDKASGQIIASKKIIDRKFGGLAGGDEDKGQQDFAEKVAAFIKNGK